MAYQKLISINTNEKSKAFHIYHYLTINSFQKKPLFLRVCISSLLKTLWEKEKLLVTSNFSFSHSIF